MNVLLVDDDKLILQSLRITLEKEADITVVDAITDGHQALEICKKELPDLILMDIQMPNINGIQTTRLIKESYPDALIMMLTTFADREHIKDAMAAGANGYLLKTDPLAELAPKLRLLKSGTGIMSADALKELTMSKKHPGLKELTPRELDITRLVAEGLSNKEIAATLFLSEGTVRNRMVIILEKMGVENRTQLGLAYSSES